MKLLLAALVLTVTTTTVGAQQIWRCGPDGKTFSDRPCIEGRSVSTGDRRTDEEIDAAREVASREQRLADTLASERAQRAQVAPGAGLIAIGPLESELQAERRKREIKRQRGSKRSPVARRSRPSDADI